MLFSVYHFPADYSQGLSFIIQITPTPVSYTHLDVYKRQKTCSSIFENIENQKLAIKY